MKKHYLILLLITIMFSCKKETETADPKINPEAIYINESENNQYLESIDSSRMVWKNGVKSFNVGDLIVGSSSNLAPYGYLRKVTDKRVLSTGIELTTEDVPITDLIYEGQLICNQQLTSGDILETDESGEDVSERGQEIKIGIENKVLYDRDGNNNTTNDQIRASGNISIDAAMNYRLDIDNKALTYALCSITGKVSSNLTFNMQTTNYISYNKKLLLKTIYLKPVLVTFPGLPFPVPVRTVIVFYLDSQGNVSATTMINGGGEVRGSAGIEYVSGNFRKIGTVDTAFYLNHVLGGEINFEGGANAGIKVAPFGLYKIMQLEAGGRIEISLNGKLIPPVLSAEICGKFYAKGRFRKFKYLETNLEIDLLCRKWDSGLNCDQGDLNFLKTVWTGSFSQIGWGTYTMIWDVKELNNCTFSGQHQWPSFCNGITSFQGYYQNDTLYWQETNIIQGCNLVNSEYKGVFSTPNQITGWGYLNGDQVGTFSLSR